MHDGNSLSLSKFDVSGKKLQRGLKRLYLWRTWCLATRRLVHLTFILNDNANPLPKGHPVKLEITDPSGKLVYKNVTSR